MEYSLRHKFKLKTMTTTFSVLILILMEYSLRQRLRDILRELGVQSLNPYSNGI